MEILNRKYIVSKDLITEEESKILMTLEEYLPKFEKPIKELCFFPCSGLKIDTEDLGYFPEEAVYLNREQVIRLISLLCVDISLDDAMLVIYGENNEWYTQFK